MFQEIVKLVRRFTVSQIFHAWQWVFGALTIKLCGTFPIIFPTGMARGLPTVLQLLRKYFMFGNGSLTF